MIVIVGLVVLLGAVIVGFTGMLTIAGVARASTNECAVFGGARHSAGRARDARHELKGSQRESAFLNR